MARDTQIKKTKKEISKKNKKQEELSRKKKSNKDSDNDSDDFIASEDEDDEMDMHEYRKFLSKMFPSKFMDKKVKTGNKLKNIIQDEEDEDEESEAEEEAKKPSKKLLKSKSKPQKKFKGKKSKKEVVQSLSDESDSESESEEDDDDDDDSDEVENGKSGKFNIIFTIGQKGDDEDEWDDDDEEWEDCDENDFTEDEDESVSTDTDDDEDEDDGEDDENEVVETSDKKVKSKSKKSSQKENIELVIDDDDVVEKKKSSENSLESDELALKQLKEVFEKNPENKMMEQCIKDCEERIKEKMQKREKKLSKQKAKNSRIFKRIIHDKNSMNDSAFFETLTHTEQVKVIKEIREINKITRNTIPHRMALLEAKIPAIFKAAAMKKLNSLRYMEPGSGEFYKIKNWVDTFMQIPFNNYKNLPVNISDGVEACHEFMANAQQTLDSAVYGLNDAKMQIMQMLGQLVTNPSALGTAIAIKGPMGTGKTTLVKEGISKILNRPFAFIALGGATDSSFLEGHSYTYEGSVWGKIVQILIDSKCMNPVIYFDELDKISDTPKGEEIAGILTHLTDTSQNSQFHDKYFAEIDFDLSKCLFIFSYNDESKVNPILRDRMYRIMTKGYDKKQKTVISNDYLLPKIREQVKFSCEDIIIPEESLHYIIETHCDKEDGVRNLKRCLEIIYTKLNLYRLMRPGSNLFEGEMALEVSFPLTVTKDVIDKLIKKERDDNMAIRGMYV
uniref:ATPase AAA-type core domain-containing protein n=1 Tax=viral metagenome TaxID=1070528 RepID=A0A6C0HPD3_9ZZZZ